MNLSTREPHAGRDGKDACPDEQPRLLEDTAAARALAFLLITVRFRGRGTGADGGIILTKRFGDRESPEGQQSELIMSHGSCSQKSKPDASIMYSLHPPFPARGRDVL